MIFERKINGGIAPGMRRLQHFLRMYAVIYIRRRYCRSLAVMLTQSAFIIYHNLFGRSMLTKIGKDLNEQLYGCRHENRVEPVVPSINWSLCEGLHEILSTFLERSLKEFTTHYFDKVFQLLFQLRSTTKLMQCNR